MVKGELKYDINQGTFQEQLIEAYMKKKNSMI